MPEGHSLVEEIRGVVASVHSSMGAAQALARQLSRLETVTREVVAHVQGSIGAAAIAVEAQRGQLVENARELAAEVAGVEHDLDALKAIMEQARDELVARIDDAHSQLDGFRAGLAARRERHAQLTAETRESLQVLHESLGAWHGRVAEAGDTARSSADGTVQALDGRRDQVDERAQGLEGSVEELCEQAANEVEALGDEIERHDEELAGGLEGDALLLAQGAQALQVLVEQRIDQEVGAVVERAVASIEQRLDALVQRFAHGSSELGALRAMVARLFQELDGMMPTLSRRTDNAQTAMEEHQRRLAEAP